MYKKDLLKLAGSSGAGRVISKLVTFANALLTVSITNMYVLEPFYCSGQLIHWLKISGYKNNLRTI